MQVIGEHLFLFLFWFMFISLLWVPVTWLLLSIYTPKSLLEHYFKEPHFSLTETVMMKEFPGFLIRTGIFAWLALIPSLDKKRGLVNVKEYMPRWYAVALQFFMVGALISLTVFITLFSILFIIYFLSK